ncbi:MAG: ATP-binding protein, partial [Bacteroidales bacterium]|nr:ATP-binding protein [Bacteroidales bacterium]
GRDESIETSMIYSVAGRGHSFNGLIRERPFRAPHHSSSAIAIAGGGTKAFPGEISLDITEFCLWMSSLNSADIFLSV